MGRALTRCDLCARVSEASKELCLPARHGRRNRQHRDDSHAPRRGHRPHQRTSASARDARKRLCLIDVHSTLRRLPRVRRARWRRQGTASTTSSLSTRRASLLAGLRCAIGMRLFAGRSPTPHDAQRTATSAHPGGKGEEGVDNAGEGRKGRKGRQTRNRTRDWAMRKGREGGGKDTARYRPSRSDDVEEGTKGSGEASPSGGREG
ncbi:hypothetical protein C8J57DRAFT_1325741, partial [Mycena rebaudengoi]